MSDVILDLLGDPIPDGWGEPGRPPHVASQRNRQKVVLLLAMEKTIADVAAALGITVPTLRKHYFPELRARRSARLRLEGALLGALASEAAAGNVAANKEIDKRLGRHDLAKLADSVANRVDVEPASRSAEGKKAQRTAAAHGVAGKFAPPPAPLLN